MICNANVKVVSAKLNSRVEENVSKLKQNERCTNMKFHQVSLKKAFF